MGPEWRLFDGVLTHLYEYTLHDEGIVRCRARCGARWDSWNVTHWDPVDQVVTCLACLADAGRAWRL